MADSIEVAPKYKMIFLGDQATGKSSILNRYLDDVFQEEYQATVGLDFQSKNITIDDTDVRLLLYDTAGQEKFRALIPMYIRDAHIILLVYDVTRPESFESISTWFTEALNVKQGKAIYALVGNKIDLEKERKVTTGQGEKLAKEKDLLFMEVSAKTGEGFTSLFEEKIYPMIKDIFKPDGYMKYLQDSDKGFSGPTFDINNNNNEQNTNNKSKSGSKSNKKCC